MQEAPRGMVQPDKGLLEPDRFWELIEKLLLHSSRDEQKRIRQNASLSALCRGFALPRPQRDKTPQKVDGTACVKCLNVSKGNKKNDASERSLNVTKRITGPCRNQDLAAKRTKSECRISDLDVIFMSDPEAPESERLWRFALRNKQHHGSGINEDNLKPPPSIRSNEAIFEGLKKRLEDAKQHKDDEPKETKASKPNQNQKRKTHKVSKHKHNTSTYKGDSSIDIKTNKNKSKSFTVSRVSPVKSTESLQADSINIAHDLRCTPVKDLIEASETQYSKETIEHVASKKSFYDFVLKKRLRCGNRLKRLNMEIFSKKMNSSTLLSPETTRKYMELKSDYLKLCYQESSLRNQIAMLHAEISMMQKKGFHKRPATVKTITLDIKSANASQKTDTNYTKNHVSSEGTLLLPCLKPSKAIIVPQQKGVFKQYYDRMMQKKCGIQKQVSFISPTTDSSVESSCTDLSLKKSNSPKGVCSMYSLTTSLKSPPLKRHPTVLLVPNSSKTDQTETKHRLPKKNEAVNKCFQ